MPQTKRKATNKMVSLYKPHLNIIEHLLDDKGMTSASDVIRQSLTFMHDKLYPNYIFKLSPAQRLKERQVKRIEEDEQVPDLAFAESLGLSTFTASDGTEWAMHRGLGHQGYLTPVLGIKEWAESHEWEINYTRGDKQSEPDEEFLTRTSVKTLLEEKGITLD